MLTRLKWWSFFFFWPCCTACKILAPQPGIKPMPSTEEALDLQGIPCGDHFSIHTNLKSLCYIPGTNMVSVNYTSIKNNFWKKHKRKSLWPCVRQKFFRTEKAGSTTENIWFKSHQNLKICTQHLISAPGALASSWHLCIRSSCWWLGLITYCCTSARGGPTNLGNFAMATFDAISRVYNYLTPDLWKERQITKSLYQ